MPRVRRQQAIMAATVALCMGTLACAARSTRPEQAYRPRACASDAGCPWEHSCVDNVCVRTVDTQPPPPIEVTAAAGCRTDEDCAAPNRCILGGCRPIGAGGGACEVDEDCRGAAPCVNGTCTEAGSGQQTSGAIGADLAAALTGDDGIGAGLVAPDSGGEPQPWLGMVAEAREVSGSLAEGIVRSVLQDRRPDTLRCREEGLRAGVPAERMDVLFWIGSDGTVTSAQVARGAADDAVARCLLDVVRGLVFPVTDGPTRVLYAIEP